MKNFFYNFKLVFMIALLAFAVACDKTEDPTVVTADFSYEQTLLSVKFTNKSENATTFAWEFGDESEASTEISPEHTYAEYGKYTVTLTATEGTTSKVFSMEIDLADPCIVWDGEQAGNLIKGGGFELCDDKYWTLLHSGQKNAAGDFEHTKYAFGYTDYAPTAGEDGALYIFPDNTTSNGEEGTILYQKLTGVTTGQYQISGLVKAAGENKAEPLSAMNSYWFEIVINKAVPMEGDGYNYARAAGWIYGGWTGWGVELPVTDGSLTSHHLDNTVADADGKFNISEAGDYYVVVKFGKGGDTDGASFGDGIALDNLKLARIGDPVVIEVPPACDDRNVAAEDNLLKGGEFETGDDEFWGVVLSGQGTGDPKVLFGANITFGDETFKPTGGSGGALHFADNFDGTPEYGSVIFQEVTLEAADYQISALVRHSGEVAGQLSNYWFEFVLSDVLPTEATGGLDGKTVIGGFSQWDGFADMPANDGPMSFALHSASITNSSCVFTVANAGTYWIAIKQGACCDGGTGNGISLDKLALTKI